VNNGSTFNTCHTPVLAPTGGVRGDSEITELLLGFSPTALPGTPKA